ncbi:hypothetical protein [Nonlabens sp. Asnod2-A12]|uniref:hypothetical protein n=1 Tax=Nonlabens sp. Asnod2-A12 TaxID=3160578 RepID=UPI00386E24CD
MKDLSRIVTLERFKNAYIICRSYCEKTDNILDVNFRLIKDHILELSEAKVETFYKKFIETDLVFALPEFFSCERVTIPKNSTGTREYRYFSTFSMILYNAIGLNIVDTCYDTIGSIQFNEKSVFPFYPTKFLINSEYKSDKDKWRVSNNYKTEYNKYQKKLEELAIENCAVLQIDITQYFETIVHEKLLHRVYQYANKSILNKNNLDSDSYQAMEFYFESLMSKRTSIPQGRKNFISDYYGYFYLIPFDMEIETLCKDCQLSFKGMIRYVDDITIVFDNPGNLIHANVYKELLEIESKIINWILNKLGLNVNPSKTVRRYLKSKTDKVSFLKLNKKNTSGFHLVDEEKSIDEKVKVSDSKFLINDKFDEFNIAIKKFIFSEEDEFRLKITKDDRENFKLIFNEKFQKFLLKKDVSKQLIKTLENVEIVLTVDYINLLIVLFLIKNKSGKYLYRKPIDNFLKNNFNPFDKRHIHIVHILIAQKALDNKIIYDQINRIKAELLQDNYGKYLVTFVKENEIEIPYTKLYDETCFFARLNNEYRIPKVQSQSNYLYSRKSDKYEYLIDLLIKKDIVCNSIVEQIKYYISYRRLKKWDLAFNHFHNFFHEMCKKSMKLSDKSTVKNIISYSAFSLKDQLTIGKFYSRRNFNSISHPSQNDVPSEKVNKNSLVEYEKLIVEVSIKLLKHI